MYGIGTFLILLEVLLGDCDLVSPDFLLLFDVLLGDILFP